MNHHVSDSHSSADEAGREFLWDRSAPGQKDVQELEQVLSARSFKASRARDFAVPARPAGIARIPWLAVAACVVVMGIGVVAAYRAFSSTPRAVEGSLAASTWAVEAIEGMPRLGERDVTAEHALPSGQWLTTDDRSRASLSGKAVGRVTLEPNSRLRLVKSQDTEHRLELTQGKLHAFITSPPKLFVVQTPATTAVDMGCVYDLSVQSDGSTVLEVSSGWVELTGPAHSSRVPAGYRCRSATNSDPDLPVHKQASAEFGDALALLVPELAKSPETASRALESVLAAARTSDAATLWHLVSRTSGQARSEVVRRLATLVPPPASVTVDGVSSGDAAMLETWWTQIRWSV